MRHLWLLGWIALAGCSARGLDRADDAGVLDGAGGGAGDGATVCGGPSAPKCADGKTCMIDGDCLSVRCLVGVCAPRPAHTCLDQKKNGLETDIDCGGPVCPKCGCAMACAAGSDCFSGKCNGGKCAGASLTLSFAAPVSYPSNVKLANGLFSADVNGDGFADLMAVDSTVGVYTLFNDGKGAFLAPVLGPLPLTPHYAGEYPRLWDDFNGDGAVDLIWVYSDVSMLPDNLQYRSFVMLGDGKGGFVQKQELPKTTNVPVFFGADWNGDGHLDLTIWDPDTRDFDLVLGLGDGTFSAHPVTALSSTWGAVEGDFNGDGKPDLMMMGTTLKNGGTFDSYQVLLGKGDGSFKALLTVSVPMSISGELGDFNGDGRLDLLLAREGAAAAVYPGEGDGTFGKPVTSLPFPARWTYWWPSGPADFDLDCRLDTTLANNDESFDKYTLGLARGNGDGTFATPTIISDSGSFDDMVIADFNGDGRPDIALFDPLDATKIEVLMNTSK